LSKPTCIVTGASRGIGRRPHRVRDLHLGLRGIREPRRVLHFQSRAEHVGGALRATPGRAIAGGLLDYSTGQVLNVVKKPSAISLQPSAY
jgi:hypothetical protein